MSLAAAERAEVTPGALAIADERQQISWSELDAILNRAAGALLGASFGAAERIGIFAGNSAETALAYLAGLHAGVSSVPINFHLTAGEVAYILKDSGTCALFVGPETADIGLEAARLAGVPNVVGWRCSPRTGLTPWNEWLSKFPNVGPPTSAPIRPHLHYTSGTTGRPKAVESTPTAFPPGISILNYFAILRENFASNGERSPMLAVSPLYHAGPLSTVRSVGGGQALIVLSRFDAEEVLKTIEKHRVQSTLMVPTHFQRLLALPAAVRARYDVSSLRYVGHTGASCPRDVKYRMIDWFGPVLIEAYGATESGTTNTITSEEWLNHPGSVGKTVPQFELLVVGEDGAQLGANEVGRLYFRDTTGRGIVYFNDPEKTRTAHLEPGVFTLGEAGYFDDEGYVFITDRISDMIVSGGVNIYPAETEQVLIQHPDVLDVAVIGAPNTEMGEEVKALVVVRDPVAPPLIAELDQFCRKHLAGYKCPRTYDFVADIGRNAMGKVNKKDLKRRYWPTDRMIG